LFKFKKYLNNQRQVIILLSTLEKLNVTKHIVVKYMYMICYLEANIISIHTCMRLVPLKWSV